MDSGFYNRIEGSNHSAEKQLGDFDLSRQEKIDKLKIGAKAIIEKSDKITVYGDFVKDIKKLLRQYGEAENIPEIELKETIKGRAFEPEMVLAIASELTNNLEILP